MVAKISSHSGSHGNSRGKAKWSASVDTDSTHPRSGLFNRDATTIARELASRKVSPKGPSSGMFYLTVPYLREHPVCGETRRGVPRYLTNP
jgi:hypothetical protein